MDVQRADGFRRCSTHPTDPASEDIGASLKVTRAFKLIKINSTVPTSHKFKSGLGPRRALTCKTAEHVSLMSICREAHPRGLAKSIEGPSAEKELRNGF